MTTIKWIFGFVMRKTQMVDNGWGASSTCDWPNRDQNWLCCL